MLHFISRRARPAVTEGLDAAGLAAFKTVDETGFVAFLDPTDRELVALFEDVARRYREEFSFASVVDAGVAEAQGVRGWMSGMCGWDRRLLWVGFGRLTCRAGFRKRHGRLLVS
jgi:hypothetical protein